MDEACLRDKLKAMVAAVAYEGRAVLVAAWLYRQTEWTKGQAELIAETLEGVRDGAGGDREFIAMADRGIGTSPNLLKTIEGIGMFYMTRAAKLVLAMMEDEETFPFESLTVKPGKSWRRKAKAFRNAGWIEALGGAPSTRTGRGIWRRIALI